MRVDRPLVFLSLVLGELASSGSGLATASAGAPPEAAAVARPVERPTFRVARASGAIAVDGSLDEAAWSDATRIELGIETRPRENTPAAVGTEARITYDDRALYVAFRAEDPEPGRIRARLRDRDAAFEDDFVGIVLDTFGDERRAYEFFSNPLGVQMDLVQNEVTGEEDASWDAIWSSAGRLTASGYEVEIAIPYSALRFPPAGPPQSWGIDAVRAYPRDRSYRLAATPIVRGRNCYLCGIARIEGFAGIRPSRAIEVTPTLTGSRTDLRQPFPDGPWVEGDQEIEAGVTARWGITPNWTTTATINPDFSQVEADVAQLDVNTQFALFYPEKRPFFLEGADIFQNRTVLVDTRQVADPRWGLKLLGKEGSHSLALIVAEDERTNLLIPSAEGTDFASIEDDHLSTTLRYRFDLGARSIVGLTYAAREGDPYSNRLVGVDGLFKLGERHSLRIEAMGSRTRYPNEIVAEFAQPAGSFSGHGLRLGWSYDSRDWFLYGFYQDFAPEFRADLGFVPQVDYRRLALGAERIWRQGESTWYDELRVGSDLDITYDQGGALLERELEAWIEFSGPLQSSVDIRPVVRTFVFRGVEFDQAALALYGEMQPTGWLFSSLFVEVGDAIDFSQARAAERLRADPSIRLDLGRHLRLQLDHIHESLEVDAGRLFTANLAQVRATYQFDLRTFVRVIAQRLEVVRDPELYGGPVDKKSADLFTQLLLSYKLNPQTVLFLGYSDSSMGTDTIDLTRASRTYFVKLGYAWQM